MAAAPVGPHLPPAVVVPPGAQGVRALAGAAPVEVQQEINDTEDPATVIENAVRTASGEQDLTRLKDFIIKGGYEKEGGVTKLFSFCKPPGPDCYSLKREWKVTCKDKNGVSYTLRFTKTIYTSVKIPKTQDGNTQKQAQYIAGVAASMYADVVESMVRITAGHPDDLSDKVNDHMSKIRKDRFVTMVLYEGSKKIDPNATTKKGAKQLGMSDRLVTHVRLDIRGTDSKAPEDVQKKEHKDSFHPIIALTAEKTRKVAAGAQKVTYREKLKSKQYVLVPDDKASPHVKRAADLQKTQGIKDDVRDEDDQNAVKELIDGHLKTGHLDRAEFKAQISGEHRMFAKQWNERMRMFANPESLSNLMFRFAGARPLSPRVEEALKEVNNENLFEKLSIAFAQFNTFSDAEKEDLRVIMKAAEAAFQEMQSLQQQMKSTSKILAAMGTDKEGIALQNSIADREAKINQLAMSFQIAQINLPPAPPVAVAPGPAPVAAPPVGLAPPPARPAPGVGLAPPPPPDAPPPPPPKAPPPVAPAPVRPAAAPRPPEDDDFLT